MLLDFGVDGAGGKTYICDTGLPKLIGSSCNIRGVKETGPSSVNGSIDDNYSNSNVAVLS